MLNAKKPKLLFDPYTKFPGYGESGVNAGIDFNGLNLLLKINYDNEAEDTLDHMVISFEFPSYYLLTSFPGPGLGFINRSFNDVPLDCLVEFRYSEFKDEFDEHFGIGPHNRHFCMGFTSDNLFLEVIASNWELVKS